MWLTGHQTTKKFNISSSTLRRWDKQNLIETVRTPTNYRLYNVEKFSKTLNLEKEDDLPKRENSGNSVSYIYTRVSSYKQKEDLQRQTDLLKEKYSSFIVISDIGSGINFSRKGLQKLFQQICLGMVETVAVTYRDRLCRFGFEFLEFICKQYNTKIMVHFQTETNSKPLQEQNELVQDILAINTVYICKLQGRRAAENRKCRKQEKLYQERNEETRDHEESLLQVANELQFPAEKIVKNVDWLLQENL